jgi:hypothetical protein
VRINTGAHQRYCDGCGGCFCGDACVCRVRVEFLLDLRGSAEPLCARSRVGVVWDECGARVWGQELVLSRGFTPPPHTHTTPCYLRETSARAIQWRASRTCPFFDNFHHELCLAHATPLKVLPLRLVRGARSHRPRSWWCYGRWWHQGMCCRSHSRPGS